MRPNRSTGGLVSVVLSMAFVLAGCAKTPINPSFCVSANDARHALDAMAHHPKPLDRPVVILGGYHDPGIGPAVVRAKLHGLVDDDRIIAVAYPFSGSFEQCRREVIAAVEKKFPSTDSDQTVEVDVIGLSMGGVVGRYCAIEQPDVGKRLRIHRLFTVSSPHRGALCAVLPAMSQLHRDLREDSAFLMELEAAEGGHRDYEIIPYVRLGDWIVGPENAAPRDVVAAYWVPNPPLQVAHSGAATDDRILADIARRLRDEPPFTKPPPATLPAN
jgi:hypothetical protein